jgi:tRNA-Thr(GGU) m(6)t(6)A37 methyltransferase TsaA
MSSPVTFTLTPIAIVRSPLKQRTGAPKQGVEGAPAAWLDVMPAVSEALDGIAEGDEIILITWLHQAHRDVLKVHPRSDTSRPLAGVFTTRSPDRPNPLGLHRVRVISIAGNTLEVGPLEAIDGTPVVDLKPVLSSSADF